MESNALWLGAALWGVACINFLHGSSPLSAKHGNDIARGKYFDSPCVVLKKIKMLLISRNDGFNSSSDGGFNKRQVMDIWRSMFQLKRRRYNVESLFLNKCKQVFSLIRRNGRPKFWPSQDFGIFCKNPVIKGTNKPFDEDHVYDSCRRRMHL